MLKIWVLEIPRIVLIRFMVEVGYYLKQIMGVFAIASVLTIIR